MLIQSNSLVVFVWMIITAISTDFAATSNSVVLMRFDEMRCADIETAIIPGPYRFTPMNIRRRQDALKINELKCEINTKC